MTEASPTAASRPLDELAIIGDPPSTWRGRPIWAEIDLDALAANIAFLKQRAGGARVMAVVKANAYGHGAVPVAKAALEAGASYLGVICVDEGVQLRAAGIAAPIVVLGHTPAPQAQVVVEHNLTPTVNSHQFALALSRFATEANVTLPVHVKVDTGMARFGLRPDETVALAEAIRSLPGIEIEGVFTHFASADEPDKSFTWQQFEAFVQTCDRLPWIPLRHAAASAATLDLPEMALDMVRVGIAMYGYTMAPTAETRPLRPVMSLKSRLVRIQQLEAGETVSYGRTWRAARPTPVGLVMAGYADGLPRLLSNRGSVIVRGKRVPIIGRICMDQCIVDLSTVPDAEMDDEVVLIGRQGDESIDADEVAELAGTISYEVLTSISARVPRLAVSGGRVRGVQTLTNEAG